jgi:hypothetical protein
LASNEQDKMIKMKNQNMLKNLLILFSGLSMLLFVGACGIYLESSSPLQAGLSFSEPPDLNKVVQLTAVFSIFKGYIYDLHDVTAKLVLPEGIEKLDGQLEWKGDIAYGSTRTLTAKVRSINTGEYVIEARADCMPSKSEYYVGNAKLYISITDKGAVVSDRQSFITHSTGRNVQPTGSRTPPPTKPPSSKSPDNGNQGYSSP